jgi:aspartyl-tRNA synthetase
VWRPSLKPLTIAEVKTKVGQEVVTSAWVVKRRKLGKLSFLVIKDWTGEVQVKVEGKISVSNEAVVRVKGTVKQDERAPGGVEIVATDVEVLNNSENLPFSPHDNDVPLSTRLRYRILDLRNQKVRALMRIRAEVLNAFRTFLRDNGFVEITPSSLTKGATEGGAQLFRVDYFDRNVFLAQSPQFFKQLAVISGLEKVFSTTNVFRAERHNTPYHINEIYQMDVECAFATDEDVMKLLKDVVEHIHKTLKQRSAHLLEHWTKRKELEWNTITYTEAIEFLNLEWGDDFSKEDEKQLCEHFGNALFITRFPNALRPFYTMPFNESESRSFDLLIDGIEISSGSQRIHKKEDLKHSIEQRGLNVEYFKDYINAFSFGAPPHSGWSIGLDRFLMAYLNVNNIREVVMFPRDRQYVWP